MVQLLLDNGADPNSTCNTSLSAWQKVLTYQANIVHDSSCPSLSDKSYDARVLQRRYIEMMQLLVLSGADQDAMCVDYGNTKASVVGVVKTVLAPKFPLEVAPLLIVLAEGSKGKHLSKRKQLHDDGEESIKGAVTRPSSGKREFFRRFHLGNEAV
jgi:hypothetical protein